MPFVSAFSNRRRTRAPAPRVPQIVRQLDQQGLDMTSPYDVMEPNRTPYAHDFRIYAEEAADRRVAVSSRKGSGEYTAFAGETLDTQNTSTTGNGDVSLGITTHYAMPFTPATTGALTKLELTLKNALSASGPIIVEIRADSSSTPGALLADSGILGSAISTSAYGSVACRFIEAPSVTSGTQYWIVVYQQEDSENAYYWRKTTVSSVGLVSNTSGLSWDAAGWSFNFKTYISPQTPVLGIARFAPTAGTNKTLLAIGTSMYSVNDNDGTLTAIATGLSGSATHYRFAYADNKVFWVNGFDNLKAWDGTTVETITHAQLPVLSHIAFHKNVLWGVTAGDTNKLVYSVPPVEDDGSGNEWYYGWLSTNIGYVPAPKASDPISAIVTFQDALIVFTRSTKWVIYGSNPADVSPRQATGKKGTWTQESVHADENYVYFCSDDGVYRWNGAEDVLISGLVQPEYDSIADPDRICMGKWKRIIRIYYSSPGISANNSCLLFHTALEEWMKDTDTWVGRVVAWTDSDDDSLLVEASSRAGGAYFAEVDDNNLGKRIDFEYHCRNDSMGNPAVKKRITRSFPLIEGEGDYSVQVGFDKDRADNTTYTDMVVESSGARIGQFLIGDGTLIGAGTMFLPTRVRTSGYAYYWQLRVKHKAINNPVNFIGYVLAYRTKRL